ncbi:MAG: class I SAM-dependent methyltransferase [Lachnospiraceae bacterium]|nr:class I SAM-dependent methyltransferase [Lachnospiraceae bacterium]
MGKLYERADIYDLIESKERFEANKKHWAALLEGRDIRSVLDISIGTGSSTLPLLELGVKLSGSDLSQDMLDKCREKSANMRKEIELTQCDFRELSAKIDGQFDCVASTGNSLPYVTNGEVLQVLGQMDKLIRPGGYLYFDIRNWDKILREHQRFYLYNPIFYNENRVNLIQVWDYENDGSMIFHLIFTFEQDNKIVQKEHFEEHYYPISKNALLNKLKKMQYADIQVLCYPAYVTEINIDDVDWYTVIARKAR